MFVFCSLNDSDRKGVFLFFIAILAVYYFVFDLITNKKIKLRLSAISFVVSFIIVFAVFEGIIPKFGRNNIDIVNVDEIQSICLKTINKRYNSECEFNLLIEDEEIINMIVSKDIGVVENSDYYGVDVEIYPIPTEDIKIKDEAILVNKPKYNSSNARIMLNMRNGKTYEYTRYIESEVYEAILSKYGANRIEKTFENAIPLLEEINMTNEERKEIIGLINNELTNLTYQELYDLFNSSITEYDLLVCTYQNHELVKNNFSYKGFDTVFKKLIGICNKHALENMQKVNRYNLYNDTVFVELFDAKNPNLFDEREVIIINDEEMIKANGFKMTKSDIIRSMFFYKEEINQFIMKEINMPVDETKNVLTIMSYVPTYFYTNNVEELYTILAKAYNKNSENSIKLNVE